jgi:hypothetical protein
MIKHSARCPPLYTWTNPSIPDFRGAATQHGTHARGAACTLPTRRKAERSAAAVGARTPYRRTLCESRRARRRVFHRRFPDRPLPPPPPPPAGGSPASPGRRWPGLCTYLATRRAACVGRPVVGPWSDLCWPRNMPRWRPPLMTPLTLRHEGERGPILICGDRTGSGDTCCIRRQPGIGIVNTHCKPPNVTRPVFMSRRTVVSPELVAGRSSAEHNQQPVESGE